MSDFKLNPNTKRAWVKNLRSGKFKQGVGKLKHTRPDGSEEYCCLGVLAEQQRTLRSRGGRVYYSVTGTSSPTFLDVNLIPKRIQNQLINLNDTRLQSFDFIADWIEKNL